MENQQYPQQMMNIFVILKYVLLEAGPSLFTSLQHTAQKVDKEVYTVINRKDGVAKLMHRLPEVSTDMTCFGLGTISLIASAWRSTWSYGADSQVVLLHTHLRDEMESKL